MGVEARGRGGNAGGWVGVVSVFPPLRRTAAACHVPRCNRTNSRTKYLVPGIYTPFCPLSPNVETVYILIVNTIGPYFEVQIGTQQTLLCTGSSVQIRRIHTE